jgi:hypothetical protein
MRGRAIFYHRRLQWGQVHNPQLDMLFPPAAVFIQEGDSYLQSNRIIENRFGVILQQKAVATLMRNIIKENSEYGLALYQAPCFKIVNGFEFSGSLQGESNEINSNKSGNLCPKDISLPLGFLKL